MCIMMCACVGCRCESECRWGVGHGEWGMERAAWEILSIDLLFHGAPCARGHFLCRESDVDGMDGRKREEVSCPTLHTNPPHTIPPTPTRTQVLLFTPWCWSSLHMHPRPRPPYLGPHDRAPLPREVDGAVHAALRASNALCRGASLPKLAAEIPTAWGVGGGHPVVWGRGKMRGDGWHRGCDSQTLPPLNYKASTLPPNPGPIHPSLHPSPPRVPYLAPVTRRAAQPRCW